MENEKNLQEGSLELANGGYLRMGKDGRLYAFDSKTKKEIGAIRFTGDPMQDRLSWQSLIQVDLNPPRAGN